MDEETRKFLILIVNTISIVFIWMMANVIVGIYFGLGFFEGSPTWKNILYYIFLIASFLFLLKHIIRKWKL